MRYQFSRRFTATAGARVEANGIFGTRVVPRVGASYALRYGSGFWGATRLRASYGLGIKEPNFCQSFSNDPCFREIPISAGAQRTFDAGIDQLLASDRVRLSVTYFHNDFYDIVSFREATLLPPANSERALISIPTRRALWVEFLDRNQSRAMAECVRQLHLRRLEGA